jgi:hypothetical protein
MALFGAKLAANSDTKLRIPDKSEPMEFVPCGRSVVQQSRLSLNLKRFLTGSSAICDQAKVMAKYLILMIIELICSHLNLIF